jgi:hypothetical protein
MVNKHFDIIKMHGTTVKKKALLCLLQMFEATGWRLEEPEVADQKKYDLIVPTVVKLPSGRGSDEVSETVP